MRVSVIVTTYNRPDTLQKVLGGLALQSRRPDEVIVADDGSGPETGRLVSEFSGSAPFPVKHVWQEDRGFRLARIRNEAIKSSEGDYLIIMDGDCVPNRHYVGDHERLSEEGFFVQGKRSLLDEKLSGEFTAQHASSGVVLMKAFLRGQVGNGHHIIRMPWFPPIRNTKMRGIKGCSMGFFRKDVIAVNGYNEKMVGWGREDSEFAARLYKYGLRRKEHPFMAICFHLWHPENPAKDLKRNDDILSATLSGGAYWCEDGIEKG